MYVCMYVWQTQASMYVCLRLLSMYVCMSHSKLQNDLVSEGDKFIIKTYQNLMFNSICCWIVRGGTSGSLAEVQTCMYVCLRALSMYVCMYACLTGPSKYACMSEAIHTYTKPNIHTWNQTYIHSKAQTYIHDTKHTVTVNWHRWKISKHSGAEKMTTLSRKRRVCFCKRPCQPSLRRLDQLRGLKEAQKWRMYHRKRHL